jgi:hypothetical protein
MRNMKTYIKIQLVFVLALGMMIFNACTEDFERMNTSNSLVTEELVNVDLIFTYVQVASSGHNGTRFGGLGMAGGADAYCGMAARNDSNPFTVGDQPGAWNSLFGVYARNLSDIINICNKRNAENGDNALDNKIAMARILKAWVYARVTEIYGAIPYSEACLPVEIAVLQPKYDSQKSIYEDIFKELKEAAAQLSTSLDDYGSADVMYGGDVDKWRKFANSLRLRYALRVRYADAGMASANMSDLSEANMITSGDDDAFILTTPTVDFQNYAYTSLMNRGQPHSSELVKHLSIFWLEMVHPLILPTHARRYMLILVGQNGRELRVTKISHRLATGVSLF